MPYKRRLNGPFQGKIRRWRSKRTLFCDLQVGRHTFLKPMLERLAVASGPKPKQLSIPQMTRMNWSDVHSYISQLVARHERTLSLAL